MKNFCGVMGGWRPSKVSCWPCFFLQALIFLNAAYLLCLALNCGTYLELGTWQSYLWRGPPLFYKMKILKWIYAHIWFIECFTIMWTWLIISFKEILVIVSGNACNKNHSMHPWPSTSYYQIESNRSILYHLFLKKNSLLFKLIKFILKATWWN